MPLRELVEKLLKELERTVDKEELLERMGFKKLDREDAEEYITHLPMEIREGQARIIGTWRYSGYEYGYAVEYDYLVGGKEYCIVYITRGWTPEEDYKYTGFEVWCRSEEE